MTREEWVELDAWIAADLGEPRYVLLTTAEAAERVGVSQATIRQWAHRGHLHRWCNDDLGRPLYRAYDVITIDTKQRGLPTPEEVRSIATEWMRHADQTAPA